MTNNMKRPISFEQFLQVLLVLGIVFLAYNDKDGWGWLMLALCLTL